MLCILKPAGYFCLWVDQANLLKARGLSINDLAIVEHYLIHLNYFRLAGYWFPYV